MRRPVVLSATLLLCVGALACGEVETAQPDGAVPTADGGPDGSTDPTPRQITVQLAGTGTGTITSAGGELSCPGTCVATVPDGTSLTLTATATGGATFTGWSGAGCAGTAPCTFTVAGDVTLVAMFALPSRQLQVDLAGTGVGTVTSTPAGIACPGTCAASFPSGTSVTLTAQTGAQSTFGGWAGDCGGAGACSVDLTAPRAVTATFAPVTTGPNIVFVTSTTPTGDVGGLAGADAICQDLARAAGIAGTFRAWLSTSGTPAISRLGAARGWVRPDGLPVADTLADLRAGHLLYLPTLDEHGVDHGEQQIMTGTGIDGAVSPTATTCDDWTSATSGANVALGSSRVSSSGWTHDYLEESCATGHRMYCFGTDRTTAVAVAAPASYRRAFITIGGFDTSTGLAGADALCQAEATAAGLGGTYKALLASNGASAASRFSASGAPWIRLDNVPVAATAADLLTAASWTVGLTVDATGGGHYQYWGMWTGAASPGTAGTAATTCGNWSSTAAQGTSGVSDTPDMSRAFGGFPASDCVSTLKLFCLQP
ncbi:MAG: hypothetical protein H6709_07835 [Kofleriaceae bacterium]|nr:hypothetical protein [Myxococcales bacterium]MCB9571989.1 hypothetical protein [Kofleriaceae bacterium]